MVLSKSRIVLQAAATTAATTTTSSMVKTSAPVTSTMVRTLYRDFLHIIKVQQQQQQRHGGMKSTIKPRLVPQQQTTDPLQQVRDEFRHPLNKNITTTTKTSAAAAAAADSTNDNDDDTTINTEEEVSKRYQHGMNRFAFLRMNTTGYKPRMVYVPSSTTTTMGTNGDNATTRPSGSSSSSAGTQRFIYKNGQRYELSNNNDATIRTDKGYVISPYTGKNLDPQSVTRHRQNLKRAGFMNNLHAKGMF